MNRSGHFDVVIIGAGAAGMFCAAEAGRRGRKVLVVDHAERAGEKIRISGGGRCNFTNVKASSKQFVSHNPHFCISALKRFTAQDFLKRIEARGIAWHEKTQGQLFCDGSSRQIVDMLLDDMAASGVELRLASPVHDIARAEYGFSLQLDDGPVTCTSLVIATGGKSIPKLGASSFGYRVAEQFGHRVHETRPGLVPFTFEPHLLEKMKLLAGVSVEARITCGAISFCDGLVFTHRGLSGPAVLQISNYWQEGMGIVVNLAPQLDLFKLLREARSANGRVDVGTALANFLPKALAQFCSGLAGIGGRLADMPDRHLNVLCNAVQNWSVKPSGTEGYRTAEVTLGGVSTDGLDQKSMQSLTMPGLYFIGEVVDVTGWLGGYNFQWAWSSAWACANAL